MKKGLEWPKRKGFFDNYKAPLAALALIMFSFSSYAQYDSTKQLQVVNTYGQSVNGIGIRNFVTLPRDTFKLAVKDSGSMAYKRGVFYGYTGYKWLPFAGGGAHDGISQFVAGYGLLQINDSTAAVDTSVLSLKYLQIADTTGKWISYQFKKPGTDSIFSCKNNVCLFSYTVGSAGNDTIPVKYPLYVITGGAKDTLAIYKVTAHQNGFIDTLLYKKFDSSYISYSLAGSTLKLFRSNGDSSTITLSGLTSLNTLTGSSQTFATGTTGTDFGINSTGTTHTFNLPDASSSSRGLVNTTSQTFSGDKKFNGNVAITNPAGGVQLMNFQINNFGLQKGVSPVSGSLRFGDGTGWRFNFGGFQNAPHTQVYTNDENVYMSIVEPGNIGMGTVSPQRKLHVHGGVRLDSLGFLPSVDTTLIKPLGYNSSGDLVPMSSWFAGTGGSGGIGSLNGLSGASQTFATGTSGTDFNINSTGTTHNFNFPSASAVNRGLLTASDWVNHNTAFSQTRQWDGGSTGLVAATGRTSLGGTTVGQNLFTSANPSAISFPKSDASNNITWRTPAQVLSDIGATDGRLSSVLPAISSNTINNLDFAQDWQFNTLRFGTGFSISSQNNTTAINTNRALFQVMAFGTPTSAGQNYAARIYNNVVSAGGSNVALSLDASGGGNGNVALKVGSGDASFAGDIYWTGAGTLQPVDSNAIKLIGYNVVTNKYVRTNWPTFGNSLSNPLTIGAELSAIGATTFNGSAARTIGIQPASVTNAMLSGSIDLTTKVSNALPVTNGGTNNASLPVTQGSIYYGDGAKIVALAPGTASQVLQTNGAGANPSWVTLAGGGDALTSNPLSQFAATTSAQFAGVISDETGTNKVVMSDNPVLTSPSVNNIVGGNYLQVTAAAGTTTLTVNSPNEVEIVGSTTQTIVMPNATTLQAGTGYWIKNTNTGVVAVNKNGGTLIINIAGGRSAYFVCNDISSAAGGWTVDYSTDLPIGDGTANKITFTGLSTEPSAPAAGTSTLFSRSVATKPVAKLLGSTGGSAILQDAFWQGNITMWTTTTATGGLWIGTAGAGAGTYTTQLPTTTNLYTATKRARYANVVTTANQVLGQRNTEAMYYLGNTANQGGFFFHARCGFDVWTNGSRFFAGMATATTVVSADPSALNNTVGFCVDAADNGAISFLMRGTSASKTSTGFTITSNNGYDVFIYAAPNSTTVSWRIVDIVTGTEASGSTSTNAPAVNTMLTANVLASNGALTTATATQIGINKIYVQTER